MKQKELLLWVVAIAALVMSVFAVTGPKFQGMKSDASAIGLRNIICWPNDIVTVVSPKDGLSYSVGDEVEISWDQLRVNKPVKVQIMSVDMEINDDFGHCSTPGMFPYTIAENITSVEGRNTYVWTIPKDYPSNAKGSNRVIWVNTDYNIPTNPPSLLQKSRDYSDGYFSITGSR